MMTCFYLKLVFISCFTLHRIHLIVIIWISPCILCNYKYLSRGSFEVYSGNNPRWYCLHDIESSRFAITNNHSPFQVFKNNSLPNSS